MPYTKKRAGERLQMRKGGRERTKEQTHALASLVIHANSSKMKNEAPMYAFTLKKRQNPTPIKTSITRENIISSSRKRQRNSLCNNAFIATENIADNRKMMEASNTRWVMLSKVKSPHGRAYGVKGASVKKSPKDRERVNKGRKPVLKNSFCLYRLCM